MGPKKGVPVPAVASKRKKKDSQPTQRPPMQRIKVIGGDGKVRWVWRPW